MRKTAYSFLTVLASLALASTLYAQGLHQAPHTSYNRNTMLQPPSKETVLTQNDSARNLLGMQVIARDGEDVGNIQDLKVDTNTGRIDYVIIDRGETNPTPVPLGALLFTDNGARLVVDKSRLNNVPDAANKSDQEFRQDLNTHYGVAPIWKNQPGQ